jgi:hypothetical protein
MVDVLFAVVDSLKQFLEDIVNDRAPTIQGDALILKMNKLLAGEASAEKVIVPQLPPLDGTARNLIKDGLAAQQNVVVIYAEADPKGVAPLARLLQVYIAVETIGGQVVASTPTLHELESGEGQHILVAWHWCDLTPRCCKRSGYDSESALGTGRRSLIMPATFLLTEDNTPQTVEDESFLWQGGEDVPNWNHWLAATRNISRMALPCKLRQEQRADVRTSIERLDNLMNLAGELVTDSQSISSKSTKI